MKPPLLLRIASILTLLYCAGHTFGAPWTPAVGPEQTPTLDALKSQRFDVMGSARTYWDFYQGFGWIISVDLLCLALVLWSLATLAKRDSALVRPIVVVFLLWFVANAILSWRFFFAIPLILAIAIVICLALAFISARPPRTRTGDASAG